jgi:hypothetical protein
MPPADAVSAACTHAPAQPHTGRTCFADSVSHWCLMLGARAATLLGTWRGRRGSWLTSRAALLLKAALGSSPPTGAAAVTAAAAGPRRASWGPPSRLEGLTECNIMTLSWQETLQTALKKTDLCIQQHMREDAGPVSCCQLYRKHLACL